MTVCDGGCSPRCYACGMRDSFPFIAAAALPTKAPGKRPRTNTDNAWERGILTEERPGGGRVPIMDDAMQPIGLKQYHENKAKYDAMIKTQIHT